MEIGKAIPEEPEDHDMIEPQEPVEPFLEKDSHKRKPAWARELLREAERYGAPKEYIERERGQIPTIAMWPCCVTSLIENLPPMKRLRKKERMEGFYDRVISVDHEE